MLREDANAALNRMLNAGYATGAIKMDGHYGGLLDTTAGVEEDAQ